MEVHLWYVSPDEVADPALAALLTAEERARQERYLFARHRHEYLVTRVLVRTVLSAYADVAPGAWRFCAGPHGKPEVAPGLPRIRFNLSNTSGMVVCLVAPEADRAVEVGVDVEDLDRSGETVAIADRYFAPAEVRDLLALPEAARRDRFFEYWTLKEAYIKARGLGLLIPLDSFAFSLAPPAPPRIGFGSAQRSAAPSIASAQRSAVPSIEPQLTDDAEAWRFAQVRLGPRHLAAAAVRVREGCPAAQLQLVRRHAPCAI